MKDYGTNLHNGYGHILRSHILGPGLGDIQTLPATARVRMDMSNIVDSKKLEHRCRIICAGLPSFFGLGLQHGHVPNFWRLL